MSCFGFPDDLQKPASPEALAVETRYQEASALRVQELRKRWSVTRQFLTTIAAERRRSPEPVTAFFSGGGSGSGKSTVATQFIHFNNAIEQVIKIDPDDCKEQIPEFCELREMQHPGAASIVHAESKLASLVTLAQAAIDDRHIFYDSTLSNMDDNIHIFRMLRNLGYTLVLIGTSVHPCTAMSRVLERGRETNRYVPPETVLWTHKNFAKTFRQLAAEFDSWQLYDNNGAREDLFRLASGCIGERPLIADATGMDKFLNFARLNELAKSYQEVGV